MVSKVNTWFAAAPPALRLLTLVNVGLYVVWVVLLLQFDAASQFVIDHLALHPTAPDVFYKPWQVVTYSVLHLNTGLNGAVLVLVNMVFLWWVGRNLEDLYGSHMLLSAYVVTAVGGGIVAVIISGLFGEQDLVVYGASGGVVGTMTVLLAQHPLSRVYLGPKWSITTVIPFAAYAVFVFFMATETMITMLGCLGTAFLFVKIDSAGWDISSWARWILYRRSRPQSGILARIERRLSGGAPAASSTESRKRARTTSSPQRRTYSEEELDRVLDRINAEGLDALSPEERQVLEWFSRSE